MLPESIELIIVTPERQLLRETVVEVTLPGAGGCLGILPGHAPLITELAFTENVSLRGVRVVTVRAWKPGEHVIVQSYRGTVQSRATVIYCHNLAKTRYAVGLELHSAVGTWVDILEPPRVDA